MPKYRKMFAFVSQLKAGKGLTVVMAVVPGNFVKRHSAALTAKQNLRKYLNDERVKGFVDVLVTENVADGLSNMWVTSSCCCCLFCVLMSNTLILLSFHTVSKQQGSVAWNQTPWFSAGLTAGVRKKANVHGKPSFRRCELSALHAWPYSYRKASTSSPTRSQRLAATLTCGGWCTMVACSCFCPSSSSNTEHGRTARCESSRSHNSKTTRFRLRRIWKFSSTIFVLKLKLKLSKW